MKEIILQKVKRTNILLKDIYKINNKFNRIYRQDYREMKHQHLRSYVLEDVEITRIKLFKLYKYEIW